MSEVTNEMIAAQMNFLAELLMLMDGEFFDAQTNEMQAKLLAVVNKYADVTEVAPNETFH